MCINLRPSRQPSVKFANQNGSVQLYTEVHRYKFLHNNDIVIKYASFITHLKTQFFPLHVISLREGYALLKCFSLTLARACAAKGYCSRSVCRFVGLSARFLSNRGCCRYQTWICWYVQRALGTARVWNVVVKEQPVHGGRLKFTLMCIYISRES